MGSIRKTPSGKHQARFRDPNGKLRGKTFDRKSDAVRFLARTSADIQRGEWRDPRLSRITFAEWASSYMQTTVHLRPSTQALYAGLLQRHLLPTFGRMPIGGISNVDIRQWTAEMNGRGCAPGTVTNAYRLLARILNSAVDCDLLPKTPCVGVKLPKSTREEMHFLTAAQVHRLGETIHPHYRALVYTAAYTGLRWGELTGLRMGRINLLRKRIEVVETLTEVDGTLAFGPPKTESSRRVVSLPGSLADLIEQHIFEFGVQSPESLVFTTTEGVYLRRSNFRRRLWLPALHAAGLPRTVRFHDLRHTCAALLIAQGAHPKLIQARLGHSTIRVTFDRYGHLFPSLDENLTDALEATFSLAKGGM